MPCSINPAARSTASPASAAARDPRRGEGRGDPQADRGRRGHRDPGAGRRHRQRGTRDRWSPASARPPAIIRSRSRSCLVTSATRTSTRCRECSPRGLRRALQRFRRSIHQSQSGHRGPPTSRTLPATRKAFQPAAFPPLAWRLPAVISTIGASLNCRRAAPPIRMAGRYSSPTTRAGSKPCSSRPSRRPIRRP